MLWRTSMRAIVGVALFGLVSVLEGAQEVVRLGPSADCGRCQIELVEELELRHGGEEYGGVASPLYLVQDSRDRYYLSSSYGPATVQVYDGAGRFLTAFGRQGQGPDEFQSITKVLVGRGDTLRLFDAGAGTLTVVSPEYEIVRRTTLRAPVTRAVEVKPGIIVANARIPTPERFGYPLHVIRRDSLEGTIGPAEAILGRTRPAAYGLDRSLAPAGDGTFWAAHFADYVIDRWTTTGTRLQRLRGHSDWFEKEERSTVRGRYNPLIIDTQLDDAGRLWIHAVVRSERFDELAQQVGTMPGAEYDMPIIQSRTGDNGDLEESILEVIDPQTGEILATERYRKRLKGFLEPDRVYAYEEDQTGGRIIIWKARLVAG